MSTGNFGHGVMFLLLMVIFIISSIVGIFVSAISGNIVLLMFGIGFVIGFVIGWLMKKYKEFLE